MDIDGPPDIVVVAGGDHPTTEAAGRAAAAISSGALVVGVDAGVATALALGGRVDVAVGDFDSLAPELVADLDAIADEVHRHPTDKDATDLELALDLVAGRPSSGHRRLLVVGLEGDRPDHALANLLLLASPARAGVRLAVGA